MAKAFEVRWEGELAAEPQQVWDAFTVHTRNSQDLWIGVSRGQLIAS